MAHVPPDWNEHGINKHINPFSPSSSSAFIFFLSDCFKVIALMAAFVKRGWKSYKFETQMAYGSLPHDMSAVASWARLGRDEGRNVTRSWNLTMVPALLKLLNGKCPFKRTASWVKTYQHDLIRKNGHRAIWTTWKITILKKGRGCDWCPHFIRFSRKQSISGNSVYMQSA